MVVSMSRGRSAALQQNRGDDGKSDYGAEQDPECHSGTFGSFSVAVVVRVRSLRGCP